MINEINSIIKNKAVSTVFQAVTQADLLSELEILCRDKAIKRFAELKLLGKLFLNSSPLVY